MAIRTEAQIIADAITYLQTNRPDIATFVGTVVRDLVIESPAQEFGNVYTELSQTQELQSVVYAADMTTDQLDALGGNYGMTRLSGSQAIGTITF